MSKFESCEFYGGYDDYAVSKEKFTKEQAIEKYKLEKENMKGKGECVAVCDAYVRHRAGINEDKEPCVGWWLEYKDYGRSCPVWCFHKAKKHEIFKDYEYITIAQ
jgi:hypothetical protein